MDKTTKSYLQGFIDNKVSESTSLEFKDPESLEDNSEIAKDISAMANSDGGEIIYGLCDINHDQISEKIKWVSNPRYDEKIMQVLQTRVMPQIDNLKINSIQNPDNNKEFAFVVEVPKSDKAPHQSSQDKIERRFWRRNGSTIRQMEYYEIEDLFFKRKRPQLKIILEPNLSIRQPVFDVIILNEGKIFAEKGYFVIKLPERFDISGTGWNETDRKFGVKRYQYYHREQIPFFPGIRTNIGKIHLLQEKGVLEEFQFVFMLTCEDMGISEGVLRCNFLEPTNHKEIEGIVLTEEEFCKTSVYANFE